MRDSRLEKSVIAESRNSIEESEKTFLRAVRVFNVFLFFFMNRDRLFLVSLQPVFFFWKIL